MPRLGKFVQSPDERKRYAIDFSEWLDAGETLVDVTFEVIPSEVHPLVVDGGAIAAGALSVVFFVSGGDDGETYRMLVKATTSGGQVDENFVVFVVKDPGAY